MIAKQKITYEYHVTKLKRLQRPRRKTSILKLYFYTHFVNFEEGLFGIVAIPEKDRQRHPGWKQLPLRLRAVAIARGLEGIEDPALGLESLCSGLVKPPACDWISL